MKIPRLIFALIVCYIGLRYGRQSGGLGTSKVTESPLVSSEIWASKPPEQWPQVVLTNEASFRGHTPLHGASAFLVEEKGHRLIGATARHLLGENGGVAPVVQDAELDAVLTSWTVFPRTQRNRTAQIAGLGANPLPSRNYDWLLLKLAPGQTELPATPLHLRPTPVGIGETVHLVGVAYSEPNVSQKVYSGKVTARAYGDRFRYDIAPPVDIRGFSGAPILDDHGLVVGVMTVWFDPNKVGDRMTEAGGEDAASAVKAVR